jgi:hypothetical protein
MKLKKKEKKEKHWRNVVLFLRPSAFFHLGKIFWNSICRREVR